jgi:hypothetical protein
MEKRYLTAKETAQLLNTSPGVLANWRYRGEGPPYYRVGKKKILYSIEEAENWIQKGKQMNGDDLPRT